MNGHHLLIEPHAHMPPQPALEQLAAADAERRLSGAGHSMAEIVAHMSYWQEWFTQRCDGVAVPVPARAAHGWPDVAADSWPEVRARFVAGLERAAALAARLDTQIAPPIEFPPLANYTVGDAIVHIAQHNSHHLGQVVLLRQLMGLWPPPAGSWTW